MKRRIRKYKDIIGQKTAKNILNGFIMQNRTPDFILLSGPSGCAKSTLAEWFALRETCLTKGSFDPCCNCANCRENLQALETSGSSTTIKKINMADIKDKKDMSEIIKNIFTLKPLADQKTFYIFEEIHALGQNQDALLEEIDRIPKGVHIIACTTEPYKLKETLISRASVKINLTKLSNKECIELVNKLCQEQNISLTSQDKKLLVSATNHNARQITNTLLSLQDFDNVQEALRNLYQYVSPNTYLEFLSMASRDFGSMICYLNEFEETNNLEDFWVNFRQFMRDSVFYYYSNCVTAFTKSEKESIINFLSQLDDKQIADLLTVVSKPYKDNNDIELNLIKLFKVIHNEINKTSFNPRPEVIKPKKLKVEKIEEPKKLKIAEVNTSMLADLTGSNEVIETHLFEEEEE